MLARYCGPGLIGLGVTALIAGFMSGMAGNVSAFTTVWTYDIYRPFFNSKGQRPSLREHGTLDYGDWSADQRGHGVSRDAVCQHHGLRAGVVQFLHRAPVRNGRAWDALETGDRRGRILGIAVRNTFFDRHVDMGENSILPRCDMWRCRLTPKVLPRTCFRRSGLFWFVVTVTVVVSLATKPMADEQLNGLVYGLTRVPSVEKRTLVIRSHFSGREW